MLSLVLILAAANLTLDGWIVTEEIRIESPEGERRGTQVTEIVPGVALRRSTTLDGRNIVIRARESDVVLLVDSASKTYDVITKADLSTADTVGPLVEGLSIDESGELSISEAPFTKSGSAKVGAWSATEWIGSRPGISDVRTTLWIADRPSGAPNDLLLSVLQRAYSEPGSPWEAHFRGLALLRGVPIKGRWERGTHVVTAIVTEIRPARLDPKIFAVPAAHRRTKGTP